jgi:hypothetical protein
MDAGKRVRELARMAGYHMGAKMTYDDVAKHVPANWRPRFIAEQCELAGFPVWTSAPDVALDPNS